MGSARALSPSCGNMPQVLQRAQHRESKSGECSSSDSKGAPKAPSESSAQTFSESADKWVQFHRSADEAAAASHKAKSSSWKRDKSGKGSGGPKDSKSSAGTAAKTWSGKGSKCTEKEAGAWLKSHAGTPGTRFPNGQHQTLASALGAPHLVKLTN